MKRKNHLVLALSVALIAAFSVETRAQDSRPRYSSQQSGERAWTIPSDTVISVQMNTTLSSRTARVGDKFAATVTVPVYVNGKTVIPAGSVVEGRVTQVTPAKRMNRSGTIGIDFDDIIFPNGTGVAVVGSLTSDDPETRKRIDDESRVSGASNNRPSVFIGGGGAIGAVLGGISGGGRGAVLGGVAGAGAGVAGILLSKGEEAQVPSGTPFGVQIKQPLTIRESSLSETGPDPADRPQDQPIDQPDRRGERPDRYDPAGAPPEPGRPTYRRGERPDRAEPGDPQPDPADRPSYRRDERQSRIEPADAQPDPADRPVPSRENERGAATTPNLPLSSPEMVRRAQAALRDQGYYEGEADGTMSSRTAGALRAYQREHNLQETGDLDPQTAKSLGIISGSGGNVRSNDRSTSERPNDRSNDRPREPRSENAGTGDASLANVLSATANRTSDGAISVSISTQANSGGWRWSEEHVVNGDTLEIYPKAIRPTGMATQVLTRGRIDFTVRDGVQYVRRVVIHAAGGDQLINLNARANVSTERTSVSTEPSVPSRASDPPPSSSVSSSASSLHRKAEDLLAEYQRAYGVRMTGSGVEVDNAAQYRDQEIELLFTIDGFVNAAQLYERMANSFRDRQSMRGATLAMARQARRTDRLISTTSSRAADSLAAKWDSIRQDVLSLMQTYNINSSEIEN